MNSRIRVAPETAAPERRRLTILFTDLVGSTRLGRAMETEHYHEVLGGLREIWAEAAEKHGGRVIRAQGDGALIVFGLHEVGEDDGRRAAEAALDIHDWVEQFNTAGVPASHLPLRMHSGIHAGTVLLSDGDLQRGLFDLAGDVVNTTAHLSQEAGAGEILASVEALGPNANFFELAAPRGVELPLPHVRAVLGRGSVTRRFDATAQRGLTPFIGRTAILATLQAFLQETGPARQRCIVVQGEPGLGKTRLMEQLVSLDEPIACLLLRGSCESYQTGGVLQPFLQVVRSCFQPVSTAPPVDPPWLSKLGPRAETIRTLISAPAQATESRAEPRTQTPASTSGVVGELLAFFTALCEDHCLVAVLDDWQWADDASRQLLQALIALPDGPRFILASRPLEDAADLVAGAPHLRLAPFSVAETEHAVHRLLSQADPFLVERIHDYAGGVPLFIEELCHSVSAHQLLQSLEGRGATKGWLATLMVSRLGRLPPDQVAVVRAASVIGNVVPLDLLAAACGAAPPENTLQALIAADFLRPEPLGGGLRFKHGITRDAIYDAVGLHERTALHRRIEEMLLPGADGPGREDSLEVLAYHCRGAGHWELAADYADQAGDKAMAAFALDRARAQYLSAMDALERVPDRSREHSLRWCLLANKLGMACIFDPLALGDGLGVFKRAVALADELGDANALARARYWHGYMCYGFGRLREGVAHTRLALQGARESGDPRLAAQIEATLGQILTATCHYDEAIALMDNAVSAKQQHGRQRGGIAIGSAYTLACKGSALADRGHFKEADACLDEAMALLDNSTHPVANSVRNWVAISLLWQGRWAEVERVTAESMRIAENTRALLLLVVSRAIAGFARWSAYRDPAGLSQLRDAARWMESRRGQFYTSLYHGWLVEACVAEGDDEAARRHAARVLWRTREDERLGEAMTCRAMSDAALRQGDLATARHWLERGDASAQLRRSPREAALNLAAYGRMQWRAGLALESRRACDSARDALLSLGLPWHAERVGRDLHELVISPTSEVLAGAVSLKSGRACRR